MNTRKKLDKLCEEQLHSGVKTYDEALGFLREFACVYDKCKSDKEYVPGLSHYDFMYWVNPIREAFAENNYIKAVEKLIDTYMEQKEKDEGLSATGWSHTFGSEIIPHLCVKTTFVDGEVTPPKLDNPHIYDGLSVRFVGAKVNPLLWFKAYRTDVNKDLLDSISAIQVIK